MMAGFVHAHRMTGVPETRFASLAGAEVAYQVVGATGPTFCSYPALNTPLT